MAGELKAALSKTAPIWLFDWGRTRRFLTDTAFEAMWFDLGVEDSKHRRTLRSLRVFRVILHHGRVKRSLIRLSDWQATSCEMNSAW